MASFPHDELLKMDEGLKKFYEQYPETYKKHMASKAYYDALEI